MIGKDFVGVDCEWRAFTGEGTNSTGAIAIIQISSDTDAFLIDLIALAGSKVLDGVLCHVFLTSTVVGFSFDSDLDMLEKHCPKLNFYRQITKLLDIQVYYKAVAGTEKNLGLAKVATELLGKEICKAERMSNWERRPLRMS